MERARNGKRKLALVDTRPEGEGRAEPHGGRPTREQLEYLADMIRHMQVLAWRTGSSTLASILELAHREADEQRRALAPKRRPWEPV